jgi:hypothetical protein
MQSSASTSSAMRPAASPPVHCTHAPFLVEPQSHDAMHMFEVNPSTAEKVGDVVPFSITLHALIALSVSAMIIRDVPLLNRLPHSVETHTLAQKVAPSSPWRCTPFPNVVAVSAVTLCSSLVALEMTKRQPQNHDTMYMFEHRRKGG